MITVRYSSIDHFYKRRTFKTIAGARKFAVHYVGADADMGSHYAVSFDGVGKVTVEGCTLKELFAGKLDGVAALPFEVWSDLVNEDAGTSRPYKDGAFATLNEAIAEADDIAGYTDGVRIVAITDEAKAELEAFNAAYREQIG